MTAKTHNAFALATLATVYVFNAPVEVSTATLVVSLLGVTVGALIPDMDQAGNDLWDIFPAGNILGRFLRKIFYKHRTITHSILGGYIIYKILEFVLHKTLNNGFLDINLVLISVMIGYISHLLSDSFTEDGIPILFPIPLTFGIPPIRKVRIKTGRWFENFVIFPSVWAYLIYLIYQNQSLFSQLFY